MQWAPGVSRIFADVEGQLVQFGLKPKGAEGHLIPSDMTGSLETLVMPSTGDRASCGGKDQGRETRDDYTDLVYLCISEDYGAQVRAGARNFHQEWKDCFLDKVIEQDPALEESIRWALDMPHTPSPEAEQAFRTDVGGRGEYGSYQEQSSGYDYCSAGSASRSGMAGGGYCSYDGAAGNFYAGFSGRSDVPRDCEISQDGYRRYSASHGDWYHEHSKGQYSWASGG
ncbi:hypothetical protein NW754_003346 [Fusarium falciforme]|nr:hypothetical protein NW754_003346 [Fusarium falciforme]KAJ4200167.1 hypothetical protein NW767_007688 [Fusarium falciforme]KAJ4248248.1 hypothetical protein NW757_008406 [Fusarium falciforme]